MTAVMCGSGATWDSLWRIPMLHPELIDAAESKLLAAARAGQGDGFGVRSCLLPVLHVYGVDRQKARPDPESLLTPNRSGQRQVRQADLALRRDGGRLDVLHQRSLHALAFSFYKAGKPVTWKNGL